MVKYSRIVEKYIDNKLNPIIKNNLNIHKSRETYIKKI